MAFLIAGKKHRTAPQPVTGYYLDNARGRVSIVVPQAATNLITNPSMETGTTGYTAVGGATIAQTSDEQRRGVYSLKITPGAGLNDGAFFGTVTLTVRSLYAFSLDVKGAAGVEYQIYFANTLGQRQSRLTKFKATGLWQRITLPYQVLFGGLHRLYLTKVSSTSTAPFYTDGWKCQSGEDSTYFDGDSVGYVRGQVAYYWTGTPHASTSVRSGQTRSGGTVMNLKDLGFRLLTIVGLGMGTVHDVATPTPLVGGAFYQDTVIDPRQFSLVGAIHGKSEIELLQKRAALINLVRPDVATPTQPLLMLYENVDECGDVIGDPVEIVCTYQNGLTGQTDNFYQERIAITFTVYLPMLTLQGNDGQALNYQSVAVNNANAIIQRDASGVWSALSSGLSGGSNQVYALALAPDGSLYVGGTFTSAGGVANTSYIAKWNGSAWSSLGTSPNFQIYALAVGPDGTLYAGGYFTTIGGITANKIAKWNGSAWSALGTGMTKGVSDAVYSLAFGSDGSLYAGGLFTSAGGVANTAYIAKWNGSAWSALGTGMNNQVNTIIFAPDATMYAGGSFTTAGGISAVKIAKWNGSAWSALGAGAGGGSTVFALAFDSAGNLYVGGYFTSAGSLTLPDSLAIWNGSSWIYTDVDLPGAAIIRALSYSPAGNLVMGYDTTGQAVTGASQTVANLGQKAIYPKFILTGPGTLYLIYNFTTQKFLSFNLTLVAGEKVTLDLTPGNVSFISTFRGNILGTILPGSDLTTFALVPGANSISVFVGGSVTAATAATMQWKQAVWSVEGALP